MVNTNSKIRHAVSMSVPYNAHICKCTKHHNRMILLVMCTQTNDVLYIILYYYHIVHVSIVYHENNDIYASSV